MDGRKIRNELLRKTVHFLGVLYVPLYFVTGKETTLLIVLLLTLISLSVEILRRKYNFIPNYILRHYEKRGIGAHLYFGTSAVILTAFFPAEVAITGIVIGSVGDGVSGIIRSYLRNVKNSERQLPSSAGMFAFSMLVLFSISNFMFNRLDMVIAMVSCLTGTLVESRPLKISGIYINDNLSVPLVSGFFYYLLS